MYDILRISTNANGHLPLDDTTPAESNLDPSDVWLFTDPVAKEGYARRSRLDQLQQDILAYAMFDGRWALEELELKRELRRLLQVGVLAPKGTFSYLSPHPSVYRAICEGMLEVNRRKFHIAAGNDVVFVPWLARVSCPGLSGPVRIGRFQSVTNLCLCCDAFPMASNLCERALAVLHQTLRH